MRYFNDKQYLNSRILFAMKSVYGLGKSRRTKIFRLLGYHPNTKSFILNKMETAEFGHLKHFSSSIYKVGNELKTEILQRRSSIQELRSRKAMMFRLGLPCRGQRTHTNAATAFKLHKGIKNMVRRHYGHSFRRKRRKDHRSKFIR